MSIIQTGDKKFLIVGNDQQGKSMVLETTFLQINELYGGGDNVLLNVEKIRPEVISNWLHEYAQDNGMVGTISIFDQTNINSLSRRLGGFRIEVPFEMSSHNLDGSINTEVTISEYGVAVGFENYIAADSSSTKAEYNGIVSIDYFDGPHIIAYANPESEEPTHKISLSEAHVDCLSLEVQQNYLEKYIDTLTKKAKEINNGQGFYFISSDSFDHEELVNHFQFGLFTHGFDTVIAHAKQYVDPSCYCESVVEQDKIHVNIEGLVKDVTGLLSAESLNNHESPEKYMVYAINAAIAATLYTKGDLSDIHTILIDAVETLISDYGYKTCAATTPRLLNNYIEEINVKKAALSSLDSLALDERMEADEPSVMKY